MVTKFFALFSDLLGKFFIMFYKILFGEKMPQFRQECRNFPRYDYIWLLQNFANFVLNKFAKFEKTAESRIILPANNFLTPCLTIFYPENQKPTLFNEKKLIFIKKNYNYAVFSDLLPAPSHIPFNSLSLINHLPRLYS